MRAPARPRLLPLVAFALLFDVVLAGAVLSLKAFLPGFQVRRMLIDLRRGDDDTAREASHRIRAMEPEVVSLLLPSLADEHHVFRQRLIQLLGDFRDPALHPVLRQYLSNRDDYVRRECVVALGKLDLNVVYPDLMTALDDPLPSVRMEAARSLGEGCPREALRRLLEALYRSAPDVRAELSDAVRRRFPLDELAPLLVGSIQRGSEEERRQALTLLRLCLGEGVVPTDTAARWLAPPLAETARSADLDVARDAIWALARIDAGRAAELALTAAQDPAVPEGTRTLCLAMIGEIKPEGAFDAVLVAIRCGVPGVESQASGTLREVARREDASRIAACLSGGDFPPEAQEAFLQVLGEVGDAAVVPTLLAMAEDPASSLGEPARRALVSVVARDGAASVPHLVAGLAAQSDGSFPSVERMLVEATGADPTLPDPRVLEQPIVLRRERATRAWEGWWEGHRDAQAASWREEGEQEAIGLLSHESAVVRQRALTHLDRMGAESATRSALAVLDDPDEYVTGTAADLLARNPDDEVRQTLVRRLLSGADAAARAARLLARMPHASLVEPLLAALDRPEAQVRERAVEALASAGDDRAVPRLVDMVFDRNREVRQSAAGALGQFNDRRAVPRLVEGLRDPRSDVRKNCAILLARSGDASIVPDLIPVAGDSVPSVRANASAALEELTGQRFDFTERTPGAVMREAWEAWWEKNGPGAVER